MRFWCSCSLIVCGSAREWWRLIAGNETASCYTRANSCRLRTRRRPLRSKRNGAGIGCAVGPRRRRAADRSRFTRMRCAMRSSRSMSCMRSARCDRARRLRQHDCALSAGTRKRPRWAFAAHMDHPSVRSPTAIGAFLGSGGPMRFLVNPRRREFGDVRDVGLGQAFELRKAFTSFRRRSLSDTSLPGIGDREQMSSPNRRPREEVGLLGSNSDSSALGDCRKR